VTIRDGLPGQKNAGLGGNDFDAIPQGAMDRVDGEFPVEFPGVY